MALAVAEASPENVVDSLAVAALCDTEADFVAAVRGQMRPFSALE